MLNPNRREFLQFLALAAGGKHISSFSPERASAAVCESIDPVETQELFARLDISSFLPLNYSAWNRETIRHPEIAHNLVTATLTAFATAYEEAEDIMLVNDITPTRTIGRQYGSITLQGGTVSEILQSFGGFSQQLSIEPIYTQDDNDDQLTRMKHITRLLHQFVFQIESKSLDDATIYPLMRHKADQFWWTHHILTALSQNNDICVKPSNAEFDRRISGFEYYKNIVPIPSNDLIKYNRLLNFAGSLAEESQYHRELENAVLSQYLDVYFRSGVTPTALTLLRLLHRDDRSLPAGLPNECYTIEEELIKRQLHSDPENNLIYQPKEPIQVVFVHKTFPYLPYKITLETLAIDQLFPSTITAIQPVGILPLEIELTDTWHTFQPQNFSHYGDTVVDQLQFSDNIPGENGIIQLSGRKIKLSTIFATDDQSERREHLLLLTQLNPDEHMT